MADTVSKAQRSQIMSKVKSKDTRPEKMVRSDLHRCGFRFRLHVSGLPGKPDIVLPKYKTIVLVNGCFWHRHPGCRLAASPKQNSSFWEEKFRRNVERDRLVLDQLEKLGWQVLVVWECDIEGGTQAVIECLRRAGGKIPAQRG